MEKQIFITYTYGDDRSMKFAEQIRKLFEGLKDAFITLGNAFKSASDYIDKLIRPSMIRDRIAPNFSQYNAPCIVGYSNWKMPPKTNVFKCVQFYRKINDSRSGMKGRTIRKRLGK